MLVHSSYLLHRGYRNGKQIHPSFRDELPVAVTRTYLRDSATLAYRTVSAGNYALALCCVRKEDIRVVFERTWKQNTTCKALHGAMRYDEVVHADVVPKITAKLSVSPKPRKPCMPLARPAPIGVATLGGGSPSAAFSSLHAPPSPTTHPTT